MVRWWNGDVLPEPLLLGEIFFPWLGSPFYYVQSFFTWILSPLFLSGCCHNGFVLTRANSKTTCLSRHEEWVMVKLSQPIQRYISILMLKWWNGAMTKWCNGGMVKWWNHYWWMMIWWNHKKTVYSQKIESTYLSLHKFPSFDIILWHLKHWKLYIYILDVFCSLFEVFFVHCKYPILKKCITIVIGIP